MRQYNKTPNIETLNDLKKMSHHIPFDIQTEIMKRLPVLSLVRFRWVSKQWKSLIENSEFIKDHTLMNRNRSQHHLLVRHQLNPWAQYTSIIDDDTFPNQKSSLTLPPPLNSLLSPYSCEIMLCSVNGLLSFYGFHSEVKKQMAVLWNPIIKKSVGIVIPHQSNEEYVIGFGFCSDTCDPKLVKVNNRYYKESEVMIFTLSSRVWKSVSNVQPALGSWSNLDNQVCIKGCIYWWAKDRISDEDGETNVIVSFDLESEKFGQVRLPECLLQTDSWIVAEVNESLGVLVEDYDDHDYYDEVRGCGVWMMDFITKSFTKMFTIKQPTGKWPHGLFGVLGFRKNGEVIIEVQDGISMSRLEVYEPSSGRINGIGINGISDSQSVSLYQETLLLLDETSSIIPL